MQVNPERCEPYKCTRSSVGLLLFFPGEAVPIVEKAAVLLLGTGLFEISINGDQTNLLMALDREVIAVLQEVCWWIYKQSERLRRNGRESRSSRYGGRPCQPVTRDPLHPSQRLRRV